MKQIDKQKYDFLRRLHRSIGPIAGGLILDLVDLATFGPIGLFGGWILGAAVGWWIASHPGWPLLHDSLYRTNTSGNNRLSNSQILRKTTPKTTKRRKRQAPEKVD
jgi:hypothetical protein